ncbi:LGFP repeat-containing protein [Kineococcus gypseus]|uniref:LGFP repeat-containing protein n=1 Tax=Kineococcus gypseus TaxID=1637102 RepID=UPI003D7DC6D1
MTPDRSRRPAPGAARRRVAPAPRTAPAALAAAAALVLAGAPAAAAAPSAPAHLPAEVDAAARYEPAVDCAPVQPGTELLRRLIVDAYGPQTIGTARACPVGGPVNSEHHDGRALDWVLDAGDPAERALAEDFLTWLLGEDADAASAVNARRLGVMYVIWDGRIWGSYRADEGWLPYTGASPHTDHVHVSLSRRGAAAETSWWTGQTSPLAGHWVALGAERSVLGAPLGPAREWRGGLRRDHERGSVLWSARTQAREVHGAIAAHYLSGARAQQLGLPVTDERPTPDGVGRFNHFEAGSVYWTPRTGAHAVPAAVRDAWAARGWERGELGYPVSDAERTGDGWTSRFTGGSVVLDGAGAVTVRIG